MKAVFAVILFFWCWISMEGQTPSWQWAKSAYGGARCAPNGSCVDAAGNSYVVGLYSDYPVSFGNFTLASPMGNDNSFMVKYDPSGNVIWAQGFNGVDITAICTDDTGNLYITGAYSNTFTYFGTYTLYDGGYNNVFVVKYNSSGGVVWAKGMTGNSEDMGTGIAVDNSGNVYVAGSYSSYPLVFGSDTLPRAPANQYDFTAKFDAAGNGVWAKAGKGNIGGYDNNVSVDKKHNVYVTGIFNYGPVYFDTTRLDIDSSAATNTFVVRYDAAGNLIWAKKFGGTFDDQGFGIATYGDNSIYITGSMGSPQVTIGTQTFINPPLCTELLTIKYDSAGNVIWARSAGGKGTSYGVWGDGISVDRYNNIYITGFYSTMILGTDTLSEYYSDSTHGGVYVFVVKYDSNGNTVWAQTAGGIVSGNYGDQGVGLGVDTVGNVYVSGFFGVNSVAFGNNIVYDTSFSAIPQNTFMAKLGTGSLPNCNGFIIDSLLAANVTCFDDTTGSIQIYARGGTAPINYSVNNGATWQTGNVFNHLAASTYSAKAKDANNCQANYANNPVNITQPASLLPSVTPRGDTLSTTLYSSYQWYHNGVEVPGATAQTYIATQTGFYEVMVADSAGCNGTSDSIHIVVSSTGNLTSNEPSISIFPDPFSFELNIKIEGLLNTAPLVEIYDLYARKLLQQRGESAEFTIVTSGLATGAYLISFNFNGETRFRKIIKQ